MKYIVTESIQLQTIKDGSVCLPYSMASIMAMANIMQDIVTESFHNFNTGSVWLQHDTVLACPPLANIMHNIVIERIKLQNIK